MMKFVMLQNEMCVYEPQACPLRVCDVPRPTNHTRRIAAHQLISQSLTGGRRAGGTLACLAVRIKLDGDGLEDHPEPVSAIIVCAGEEVTPGSVELLVLKLDGDILLLCATRPTL